MLKRFVVISSNHYFFLEVVKRLLEVVRVVPEVNRLEVDYHVTDIKLARHLLPLAVVYHVPIVGSFEFGCK
jgi:hypothetical protein